MTPCTWGVEVLDFNIQTRGSAFNKRQRSRKSFIINDEFVAFSSWQLGSFEVQRLSAWLTCGQAADTLRNS